MNQKQTVSLETVLKGIKPIDKEAVKAAKAHWDRVAKPLNSLGVLEEDICRIAGVKRREEFSLDKKCIVIMCADNGIVAEGVTQTGRNSSSCQKYGSQKILRLPDGSLCRGRSPSCRCGDRGGYDRNRNFRP